MNNDEVEKNIIEAIELLGKVMTKNFKFTNDRISNIVNLLTIQENEEKPDFPQPPVSRDTSILKEVIISQEGNTIPIPEKEEEESITFTRGVLVPYKFIKKVGRSYKIMNVDGTVGYIGESLVYPAITNDDLYLLEGKQWVLKKIVWKEDEYNG